MKNFYKVFFIILVLAVGFLFAEVAKSPSSTEAAIYFFDVGQGDAALIQKGDFQILIDGGPDDKVLAELGKAMPIHDRKIEVMILSHPHADHITGLNSVLDRYEVGKIYGSGVLFTSDQYLSFLSKIKEKKIDFEIPTIGEKTPAFDGGVVDFLWPGDKFQGKTIDNLNNSSLVLNFCYQSNCALFTGDAEKLEQDEMLSSYSQSDLMSLLLAKIIKIPHHGSANGANQALLDAAKPEDAVISVGKDNQFGHPHPSALEMLNKAKIQIFRTDVDGTIEWDLTKNLVIKR